MGGPGETTDDPSTSTSRTLTLPNDPAIRGPGSVPSIIVRALVIAVVAVLIDVIWVYPDHKHVAFSRIIIFATVLFVMTWVAEMVALAVERAIVSRVPSVDFERIGMKRGELDAGIPHVNQKSSSSMSISSASSTEAIVR